MSATAVDRSKFMGGSDIAAALGISVWKSAFRLWQEKTGRLVRDDYARQEEEYQTWGRFMEPSLLRAYTHITGRPVVAHKERRVHPVHPWITGELDAITEDGTRVIEAKNAAYHRHWGDPEEDGVPEYYVAQGMWYLELVPGAVACDFPASLGGRWPRVYEVARDDRLIANLIEFAVDWWERHVVKDEPPDPTTMEDVAARWQAVPGKVAVADKDAWILVQDLARVKAQIKALEAREERLGIDVRKAIADATELVEPGGAVLATYRPKPTNRFNVAALEVDHPELAAKYRVIGSTRELRIKVKADPVEPMP